MFFADLSVIVVCFGVIFGWSFGDLGVFVVNLLVVLMIVWVIFGSSWMIFWWSLVDLGVIWERSGSGLGKRSGSDLGSIWK